jgi:hypothetical protein
MFGVYKASGFGFNRVYVWEPNPALQMTPDEQYKANRKIDPEFKAVKIVKPVAVPVLVTV